MKIEDALARVDELKPHSFERETLVRWLSNLDLIVYEEVISWHRDVQDMPHGPYDPQKDMETVLMIPDPYSDIYIHWLCAQIDYFNGDMQRYQNSMIAYNTALSAFADWFNRKHESIPVKLKVYGG